MNEPPDISGGFVPPAVNFVTIASNESGMDTDGSVLSSNTSSSALKRSRSIKMCRSCNKRRRKRNGLTDSKDDCCCITTESIKENIITPVNIINKSNNNNNLPLEKPQSQSNPSTISRNRYESTDIAPFIVHIQKEQSSPDDNVSLHPLSLGRLLKTQGFKNIINGSLKRIGRNRMSLTFVDGDSANAFISNDSLAKQKLKAFIPTFHLTRMGLIRGVPAEWSPEEILENVNVPIGCGNIIKIRRLNYKSMVDGTPTWKPSQTIVVTFDGQILPKRIYICYNSLSVELYIYPTIQCFNCCRFGHTKVQCRSKPRCYKCGQDHAGSGCDTELEDSLCCLCSGAHFAISKSCPEFTRQNNIKRSMAECCISYPEATKLHPPVGKSYAEVIKNSRQSQPLIKMAPPPVTTSYKKTIISKPKTPYQANKGYDRDIHNELIKEYNIPSPTNGCALNSPTESMKEQSLTDIIVLLIQSLSQSNLINSDHAAPIMKSLEKFTQIDNGYTPSKNNKQ